MNDRDVRLERLKRLDTCALSDALDRLGRDGAIAGLRQVTTTTRICGRVRTVKLGAAKPDEERSATRRHLATAAIEAAEAGEIIALEQRTGVDAACWGGTLSLAASLRGLAGVVADGPVRDIDEARDLGFPVFARTVTARSARGRIQEIGWDVPIRVGAIEVNPGDYVVADATAVVFVPGQQIDEVMTLAEEIVSREAAMAAALRAGTPVSEIMGAAYEDLLKLA